VYLILVVFYYDPRKVSEFLDSIARGFVTSPLQYILFGAIILLLVAGLLVAYRVQRGRARRQENQLGLERFERLAGKLGLSGPEREVLDRLAGGRLARKLRLLASPAAFNHAVARLEVQTPGAPAESSLAELRLKLGFQAQNPERVPSASSELPVGLPVVLVWSFAGARYRLAAEVAGQQAEALTLACPPARSLPGGSPPEAAAAVPPAGSQVTVIFQNRAGVFSFRTTVLAASASGGLRPAAAGCLRLDQVEKLQRIQRRKYYRRRLRLPVQVQAREGEPQLASQLLDLGGDGASLVNPRRSLSAGDLAELSFRVGNESFRLTAEVLRVSRDGQVLHVRFYGLHDADRDRLLGALFRSLGEAVR
jgi:hypothetical protein